MAKCRDSAEPRVQCFLYAQRAIARTRTPHLLWFVYDIYIYIFVEYAQSMWKYTPNNIHTWFNLPRSRSQANLYWNRTERQFSQLYSLVCVCSICVRALYIDDPQTRARTAINAKTLLERRTTRRGDCKEVLSFTWAHGQLAAQQVGNRPMRLLKPSCAISHSTSLRAGNSLRQRESASPMMAENQIRLLWNKS